MQNLNTHKKEKFSSYLNHFHFADASLEKDAWTTALVIAFLELRLANRQVEWQFMAKKALDWLAKVTSAGSIEGIMAEARRTLASTLK